MLTTFQNQLQLKQENPYAENALLRSRDQFNSLVNNLEGIVWEADAQTFKFTFVSNQAEALLGYNTQQWINEPGFWKDHIHPADRDWALAYCMECTRKKKSHKFEYRMISSDGRVVWLQDIVTVIVENEIPVLLTGLMIDITERKKNRIAAYRQRTPLQKPV